MITTIYFIRHSIPFKEHRGINKTNEPLQIENEKSPLSIAGEKLAYECAKEEEFQNLDIVFSSNYVRAMSTAKYFAYNNNLKVNIDERFNERKHGVNSYNELPSDFETRQFEDEDYKLGDGESQKEVRTREYNALMEVINENKGKTIAIVSHSTAMAFLFSTWCDVKYDGNYTFKGKPFFNGHWNYVETFKLEFDDENNLVNIENIIRN